MVDRVVLKYIEGKEEGGGRLFRFKLTPIGSGSGADLRQWDSCCTTVQRLRGPFVCIQSTGFDGRHSLIGTQAKLIQMGRPI